MNSKNKKTFSSAREVFRRYLPKSTEEDQINNKGKIQDISTRDFLDVFKSGIKKQTSS
jgi:hypothetical protein